MSSNSGKNTWTVDPIGSSANGSTPPPGFVTAPGLWSENGTATKTATSTDDGDSSSNGGRKERPNERTSSFNNIAAALGNGLAESMEDATRGDHLSKSNHDGVELNLSVPSNLTDNFFNPNQTNGMNYERHKRHAASRLLGAPGTAPSSTSSSSSPKPPDAGPLFGSLDASEPHSGSDNSSNLIGRSIGAPSSGGIDNSSTLTSPFPHDPKAPAFTPMGSSLKYNSSQTQNGRDDRDHGKSRLPVTKDLGCTVMEPDSNFGAGSTISSQTFSNYGSNRLGKPGTDVSYGIQADMQNLNLWSDSGGNRGGSVDNRNLKSPATGGLGDRLGSSSQPVDAETELLSFTWDTNHHEPSRTLAVFNAPSIPPNEVISICETFGATEAFRSEFLEALGVVFISFFDMRCAQFAAMQLPMRLQRSMGGGGGERVQVKFCVPLNSSSRNDESLVVINDLPHQISADNLGHMLSSFGAIRSLKNLGGGSYGGSFVAEFHDVQDARKVVFELESTQPWGPDVSIEIGGRNPADRKKGRELLAMLGRWRNHPGVAQSSSRPMNNRGMQGGKSPDNYRPHDSRGMGRNDGRYDRGYNHDDRGMHHGYGQGPQDGRYHGGNTYVMHQQHPGYPQYRGQHHPNDNHGHHGTYMNRSGNHAPPHQQHFYQQPQSMSHNNYPDSRSVISGASSRLTGASGYYTPDDRSIGSHNSNLRSINSLVDSMAGNTRDGQSQHLILDLEAVENGLDTRTSLMVRNIPNKYTQQMLLREFTENDHGPGIIDFFYLPIDFKNRCNRGYAFINFVDYHDILNFHRQYYGQHWRTFNSDKICDITYARIQGKAAMLKRFENSALMEKDEEYKPLVFVSSGPERGKRLPFPESSRGS